MTHQTRWWWVRHAPVLEGRGRLYGQTDLPCDTSDTETFCALAAVLPGAAVWITSHLVRAVETARAIRDAGAHAPEPERECDLAEQAFGDWQGMTWDEIRKAFGAENAAFWRAPGDSAPPGGESLAQVITRVAGVIERVTAANAGRDIVAVAHAGSIRAAVAMALGLDAARALAFRLDNLSVTRLDHDSERTSQGHAHPWRVILLNTPARWIPAASA
ncbi:MAG TPA: histidine phosphatase family protein [Rhodospirillales bacterium]|nr:histidine phosphatase family protein [Rhodospirillales bacterium]HJO69247.1 histidine phosphatase family protein [Rhodospirillales bacterium]